MDIFDNNIVLALALDGWLAVFVYVSKMATKNERFKQLNKLLLLYALVLFSIQ